MAIPPRLRRLALGVLLLAAVAESPLVAQEPPRDSPHRSEVVEVTAGPDTYRLRVFLPSGYDTIAGELPVLYYLDAWWWGGLMEDLVRMSALAQPPRIEPLVLVGISTAGGADEWNRARNRDFTPTPYRPIAPGVELRTGRVVVDSAGTGGADAFLDVFVETIRPAVEDRYRVSREGRGIAGHSYGGLFATWVLATRPHLFDTFLVVSPAIYWNDGEVLDVGVFRDSAEAGPNRVFLASGGREAGLMRRSADSLAAALESLDSTEVRRIEYDDADHLTVLPRALLDGLIHLYGR